LPFQERQAPAVFHSRMETFGRAAKLRRQESNLRRGD
jgi:hypothetical protein